MFELCSQNYVDLKKFTVMHLFQSLNQPHLSPEPGLPAEPSQAFFIVSEAATEKIRLFVGLCFLNSSHRILYGTTDFVAEDTPERLAQAEAFVGEMGFLMDDLHFRDSSEQEQKDMLRTTPFFYQDHATFMQALSGQEKQAKGAASSTTSARATGSQKYSFFLEHYVRLLSML